MGLDDKEAALACTGFVNVSTFLKLLRTIPFTSPPTKVVSDELLFGQSGPARAPEQSDQARQRGVAVPAVCRAGVCHRVTSDKLPAIKAAIPKLSANIASLDLKLDTLGTRSDRRSERRGKFETQGVGPVYTDDDGKKTQNGSR